MQVFLKDELFLTIQRHGIKKKKKKGRKSSVDLLSLAQSVGYTLGYTCWSHHRYIYIDTSLAAVSMGHYT